ncbi:outer membrane beta-barrel protein [Candidatus Avelusimicrobium fimicolum]|uniref:outer membrane beta-barrel protein n=1 Tax=Candidatus Avelusimicrobium fimicolum TaxID=3416216 RepID=UPI003D0E89B1
MKHLLLLALLLFSVSSYAQIYHAEQGTPVNFSRLEISVGMGLTSSSLQDPSGDTIIHDKNFTDFRLLYGLSSRFALGPAIYFSNKQDNQPLISSYKTRRLGVLGKFNLSPDTTPHSYAVAEAGAMKRFISYLRSLEDSATSPYLMFGLGTEVDIYSGFFLGLEGRVSYFFKDKPGPFFQLNSPWEASFTLRTGFHF